MTDNDRPCAAGCGLPAAPGDRYCDGCGSASDRSAWAAHEGEMRAQEGIERAYAHAQEEWLAWAEAAVLACADTLAYFTSDDVQRLIPEGVTTREPRALGGVMRRAKARGLIYPTADFALSDRPVCHRNPKRVWGSWRNRLTYIARVGDPVG